MLSNVEVEQAVSENFGDVDFSFTYGPETSNEIVFVELCSDNSVYVFKFKGICPKIPFKTEPKLLEVIGNSTSARTPEVFHIVDELQSETCRCYYVMEYIDGDDLSSKNMEDKIGDEKYEILISELEKILNQDTEVNVNTDGFGKILFEEQNFSVKYDTMKEYCNCYVEILLSYIYSDTEGRSDLKELAKEIEELYFSSDFNFQNGTNKMLFPDFRFENIRISQPSEKPIVLDLERAYMGYEEKMIVNTIYLATRTIESKTRRKRIRQKMFELIDFEINGETFFSSPYLLISLLREIRAFNYWWEHKENKWKREHIKRLKNIVEKVAN